MINKSMDSIKMYGETVKINVMHCYVCSIPSYLKSVLKYKFSISDTYRPNTLYLREQRSGEP